jgi:hypothetical protein
MPVHCLLVSMFFLYDLFHYEIIISGNMLWGRKNNTVLLEGYQASPTHCSDKKSESVTIVRIIGLKQGL